MALKYISRTKLPNYIALSTDIADGKISGLSVVGAIVFLTDTQAWYIVERDLTLSSFTNNFASAVFSITDGESTLDGGAQDAGSSSLETIGVDGTVFTSSDLTTPAAVTGYPTEGTRLLIDDIVVSSDTTMSILFGEEDGESPLVKVFVPANGTVKITPRSRLQLLTVDKRLFATASVAGNVAIQVLSAGEEPLMVWMLSETTARPSNVIGLWEHDGVWRSDAIWYGGS